MAPVATLLASLGLPADAVVVLVTADDLGLAHSANVATFDAFAAGTVTGASLLVPAPWAREAAATTHGEPVGVELTLTAEHQVFRWGPITSAPSLLGGDGGFPGTVGDVVDHADLDEARRELRAQIERAVLWGFDVTHLASHDDVLGTHPAFLDLGLELALEFALPLRPPRRRDEELGFPATALLAAEGIVVPDHVVRLHAHTDLDQLVDTLEPGVTELILRPAFASREITALAADAEARVEDDLRLRAEGPLERSLTRRGAIRTSWRALRELQRAS